MRVLHFLNIPLFPQQILEAGSGIETSGGWMAALIGNLHKSTDFELGCAFIGDTNQLQHSAAARIDCYALPKTCGIQFYDKIVQRWKPDIIHVHGTENAFGLIGARRLVSLPIVISLQGLMGPYSEWYHYFGNRSLSDIVKMHRFLEIPLLRGQWKGFIEYRAMAKREKEIIKGNIHFMGRTEWDQAFIRARNPSAHYYHAGEMIRQAFFEKQWTLASAQRHRIIFTNAGHPRKGAEVLLEAVNILKQEFPTIELALAGSISLRSGYGRYIRKKIAALGGTAIELGPLNSRQMAIELLRSHVFVSPSFIDNSPNAVCEAQLLGMPVISSYTGGVPSLIEEGRSGLFFPCGDVPMLVSRLRNVFENDDQATQIGVQARDIAKVRHDPGKIIREITEIYHKIVNSHE